MGALARLVQPNRVFKVALTKVRENYPTLSVASPHDPRHTAAGLACGRGSAGDGPIVDDDEDLVSGRADVELDLVNAHVFGALRDRAARRRMEALPKLIH